MDNPVRILCVFSTLDRGGAESMCMNIYRRMDREKVQFDFVKHTDEKGDFEDEIKKLGGRIYIAPRYQIYNHLSYCKWWERHLKEHPEHQIIHGHYFTISAVYLKIAKRFGRITVAHSHICEPVINMKSALSLVKRPFEDVLLRRVEGSADYCLACSEAAGKWLYHKKAFQVLNNAIEAAAYRYDKNKRSYMRTMLGIDDNILLVGHVGRFAFQKNHDFLIDIFEKIRQKTDARLLLVGDGSLREDIRRKAVTLGISDKVIFAGVRSDVPDLLQAMDVFVFPSFFEGLPVTVIEAETAGLPCLISDVVRMECNITDLLRQISLSESAEVWANAAVEASRTERRDTLEKIRAAGYDVTENAEKLQNFYLKLAAGEKNVRLEPTCGVTP